MEKYFQSKVKQELYDRYSETGKRIVDLMEKEHISRKELLGKLGINDRTFRNWLNGKTAIPSDQLYILCDSLKCSADYLIEIIEKPTHDLKTVQDIISLSYDAFRILKEWKEIDDYTETKLPIIKLVDSFIRSKHLNEIRQSIESIIAINNITIESLKMKDEDYQEYIINKEFALSAHNGKIESAFSDFARTLYDN